MPFMFSRLKRPLIVVLALFCIVSAFLFFAGPDPSFLLYKYRQSPGASRVFELLSEAIRSAIFNMQFFGYAVSLLTAVLLFAIGVGLLLNKAWSRFGYLLYASIETIHVPVKTYFLIKSLSPLQNAGVNISSVWLITAATIALYWAVVVFIFQYFQSDK
jgi:hypothetical protein